MSKAQPARPAQPERPHLDWYRKAAKKKLDELRQADPPAKLADAQLAIAREHGFPSWRALNKHMTGAAAQVPAFFNAIEAGDPALVEQMLDQHPQLTLLKNA